MSQPDIVRGGDGVTFGESNDDGVLARSIRFDGRRSDRKRRKPFTAGRIWNLYKERYEAGNDILIIIVDRHNRRGTGKTTLALKLADRFDQTDAGVTPDKCAIDPDVLASGIEKQPNNSSLVLDEAEVGVMSRNHQTAVNKFVVQMVGMGRVEQKYYIINAPSASQIDKEIRNMADITIVTEQRGLATAYFHRYLPVQQKGLMKKEEDLIWKDISQDPQLLSTYRELTSEKRRHIAQEEGNGMVKESELRDAVVEAEKDAARAVRNSMIRTMYEGTDLSSGAIAEILVDVELENAGAIGLDVSQQQVSNILNDD